MRNCSDPSFLVPECLTNENIEAPPLLDTEPYRAPGAGPGAISQGIAPTIIRPIVRLHVHCTFDEAEYSRSDPLRSPCRNKGLLDCFLADEFGFSSNRRLRVYGWYRLRLSLLDRHFFAGRGHRGRLLLMVRRAGYGDEFTFFGSFGIFLTGL